MNIESIMKEKLGLTKKGIVYAKRAGRIAYIGGKTILCAGSALIIPCRVANKLSEGYDDDNPMSVGRAVGVLSLLGAGGVSSIVSWCYGVDKLTDEVFSWDDSDFDEDDEEEFDPDKRL